MEHVRDSRNALKHIILRALLLSLALAVFYEGSAHAEGFIVGRWAHQRLSKAHKAIGEKKYNEAQKYLDEMKVRKRLNDHERAMMWQTYGFVWSSKGKFKKAIECFRKCLELAAMPETALRNMEFNLGQLLMAVKKYREAVDVFRDWLKKIEEPSPHALYMIAMGYAQIKKYKHALYYGRKAVAGTKKPQESWYQFNLSLYFRFKKFKEVANLLEILITKFSKKNYWVQLASVYSQLKRDKEALAVMELAYMQGFLEKESELMNLASLFMHNGVPIKAARVMKKGIEDGILKRNAKTYKMLAESLLHAREGKDAIEPLEAAAKIEKKGDLYVQLAQVHLGREEWTKAIGALNKALKKGRLTNPGSTYILLGISRNNLSQFGAAIQAFKKAKDHKATEASAEQWIKVVRMRMQGT